MKQVDEYIIFPALPHPDLATSPSAMEEMMMQLSHVQHNMQDILEAIRNPPGKRKHQGSNQNSGPTMLMNQWLATNKKQEALPEYSLMHSQHVTSTAQDTLDAVMHKYPPRPLMITLTEVRTNPLPDSNAIQDTTVPNTPTTTTLEEKDGWQTVEAKAVQKKRRNNKANNKWAMTNTNYTPKTTNGGSGENTYKPWINTPSAKKTWAEVIKSGGINVQIVLGNSNLGFAIPPIKKRGERGGGAACRLGRKEGAGERGEERWSRVSLPGAGGKEVSTTSRGGERVEESRGSGSLAVV
jgi:hypothetical protein